MKRVTTVTLVQLGLSCRSCRWAQRLPHALCSYPLRPIFPLGILGVPVHPSHQRLAFAPCDPRKAPPSTETQSSSPSPRICEFMANDLENFWGGGPSLSWRQFCLELLAEFLKGNHHPHHHHHHHQLYCVGVKWWSYSDHWQNRVAWGSVTQSTEAKSFMKMWTMKERTSRCALHSFGKLLDDVKSSASNHDSPLSSSTKLRRLC